MFRHRDIFLFVTLATATTPVLGQDVTTPGGPGVSATQSAHSIPDFSGIWGHPFLPGFEPPLSGPGPVLNKSRFRQLFDPEGRFIPPANAPLVSNGLQLVGDYTNPILKPQAAQVVKEHGEISLRGAGYPSPSNQCWPGPIPYIFNNTGMQMLHQPDKITILYFQDHEFRQVRMNQPHTAKVTPSWYGDSIGHYDGDTLVIDTIGIKTDRPFAMLDWYGTPYTKALHVVERYRLIDYEAAKEGQERSGRENFRVPSALDEGFGPDPNYKGKGLQLQFTVEDAGVFTTPWSATITYRRALATEWREVACAENPQWYPGKYAEVPRADEPDF